MERLEICRKFVGSMAEGAIKNIFDTTSNTRKNISPKKFIGHYNINNFKLLQL